MRIIIKREIIVSKELQVYKCYIIHTEFSETVQIYLGKDKENNNYYFYNIGTLERIKKKSKREIQAEIDNIINKDIDIDIVRFTYYTKTAMIIYVALYEIKMKVKIPDLKKWYIKNKIIYKELPSIVNE